MKAYEPSSVVDRNPIKQLSERESKPDRVTNRRQLGRSSPHSSYCAVAIHPAIFSDSIRSQEGFHTQRLTEDAPEPLTTIGFLFSISLQRRLKDTRRPARSIQPWLLDVRYRSPRDRFRFRV